MNQYQSRLITFFCQSKLWIWMTAVVLIGCDIENRTTSANGGTSNGGAQSICVSTDDSEENPCWFRDLRIDSWQLLIGSDSGIKLVQEKLEQLYGEAAPEQKVDLAEPEFANGNWHYEFSELGKRAIEADDYFAATGYFTVAAFPQMYLDERALDMYDLALGAFKTGLEKENYPHKMITVTVDGVQIDAYLVYPRSYTPGHIVPVVIETGGVDGLMPIGFSDYLLHWNNVNTAWVGVDIPGLGTSKELTLSYEAEKVHVAVIKALQADESIDNDNIFVYSRSFGGYAALRLLATGQDLDVAGIAAVCPLAEYTFAHSAEMINSMPKMTRNAFATRLGIDPSDAEALVEASKMFQFSKHGHWGKILSDVPLLIYNTEGDPFNPVSEIEQMAALSENGEYVIEPGEGHCGSRILALEAVSRFVKENMR